MPTPYPYTRSEECSWQPEEVARHLASLATTSADSKSTASTHLLSHGWSTRQIQMLREHYGENRMPGEKADEEPDGIIGRYFPCLSPVISSLFSQLKEPLILMLLGSAGLSLILGNTADAVSIGIALLIVSLVAAVQEWRSEVALEKLHNLVPPTCTVLRDGNVTDHYLARDLVVGDLVLLSTGE